MNTYLFTWNPQRWSWIDLEETVQRINQEKNVILRWSCGVTRKMNPGDRGFLMKLGPEEPKGIIGAGRVVSQPYADKHYSDPNREAYYVEAEYDILINPYKDPILTLETLKQGELSKQKWTPEASGVSINPELAIELEAVWFDFLRTAKLRANPFVPKTTETYWEGASFEVKQTRYERNPQARKECINHYGTSCIVCRLNFEEIYGGLGTGFIHVHHLNPVANAGGPYQIDPIRDLRPVCPNCHAMIHRSKEPLSVEAMQKLVTSTGRQKV
jgi:5-methylcytosine-specific restriction protein A